MNADGRWFELRERGSLLGMRIITWVYRRMGRPIARLLLYPIVGYFYLSNHRARRASLDYLKRLHAAGRLPGALPGQVQVFRHLLAFGNSILDRVGFWLGRREDFELDVHGMELLDAVAGEGRGALVLGAHLGSFDAMRLVASLRSPIRIHVLMHTANAPHINTVLGQLEAEADDLKVGVLPMEPGRIEHVLKIRSRVQKGDVVALLADRSHPNEAERSTPVDFLGAPAPLPQGPMLLAAALRCPVLFMVGIRTGSRHYEIHVEKFADPVTLPRQQRPEAVQRYCQSYADRLARYCEKAPHQWFNFYDFWSLETPHDDR
ncbi:MAG: hypothetical protein HRU02_14255 [Myxococcales bacterium]|nr:hypothetical protein [Myxococcales bacterium]